MSWILISWKIDALEKIFSAGELSRAPSGGELYRGDRRTARCSSSIKSTRDVERETTTLNFCSLVVDERSCTERLCIVVRCDVIVSLSGFDL